MRLFVEGGFGRGVRGFIVGWVGVNGLTIAGGLYKDRGRICVTTALMFGNGCSMRKRTESG